MAMPDSAAVMKDFMVNGRGKGTGTQRSGMKQENADDGGDSVPVE